MWFSPVLGECAGLTDRLFDKIISNLEQNLLDVLVQLFRGVNLPHQLSQPNQRESNIYHWLNFWVPCLVPIVMPTIETCLNCFGNWNSLL